MAGSFQKHRLIDIRDHLYRQVAAVKLKPLAFHVTCLSFLAFTSDKEHIAKLFTTQWHKVGWRFEVQQYRAGQKMNAVNRVCLTKKVGAILMIISYWEKYKTETSSPLCFQTVSSTWLAQTINKKVILKLVHFVICPFMHFQNASTNFEGK